MVLTPQLLNRSGFAGTRINSGLLMLDSGSVVLEFGLPILGCGFLMLDYELVVLDFGLMLWAD
jgi:hypothetical protein